MKLVTGTMPGSLQRINKMTSHPFGLRVSNFILNNESKEYGACSFTLNVKNNIYRLAEITPTNTGQLVTIWKRDENGITVPFEIYDDIYSKIIAFKKMIYQGNLFFQRSVLADKVIITQKGKEEKRSIRVYPPWVTLTITRQKKGQAWQLKYFLPIKTGGTIQPDLAKQLFDNI